MVCESAREEWLAGHASNTVPSLVSKHLDACAACQAFIEMDSHLNQALKLDTDQAPGPGFDTRFFAKIAQERHRERTRRAGFLWFSAAFVTAAAAAVWLLVISPNQATDADDIELAMNLELVEELDVVANLESIEAFEVLAQLQHDELEQLIKQEPKP